MATGATPPTPLSPITCPSCGSRYNPETHELVEDTKLREQIAQLESDLKAIRRGNAELVVKVTELEGTIAALRATPPAPPEPAKRKSRDFIVFGDD